MNSSSYMLSFFAGGLGSSAGFVFVFSLAALLLLLWLS